MAARKRHNKWWVDFSFNRTRYRKVSPENSKRGAEAYEIVLKQRLARGLPVVEEKRKMPLFKEFAEEWFERYVMVNNKVTEAKHKRSALNRHLVPFFGGYGLDKIGNYEIEKFKAEKQGLGLNHKTINNMLGVLSKCLRTAQEWEVSENVPRIKKLKVPPQKFDYLSVEESERLLAVAEGQTKDMILLALYTGLRFGELIALTWNDINFRERILTVSRSVSCGYLGSTKSNKVRYIPLGNEVLQLLLSRKPEAAGDRFVFPNPSGKFLLQDTCLDRLHKLCTKAGLRWIGWHTLRHTFASRLAERGASMRMIQELLGHSDTKTTMRYAHLNPAVLRDTINLLEKTDDIICHNSVTGQGFEDKKRIPALMQNAGIRGE